MKKICPLILSDITGLWVVPHFGAAEAVPLNGFTLENQDTFHDFYGVAADADDVDASAVLLVRTKSSLGQFMGKVET